jgi:uncharacterized protein YceH (UPF0502 family)
MHERRVLGVLVEKQKTSKSADTYPLSVNALVTGCNQKSNRDPVMNLTDEDVEDTLVRCQKDSLVSKVTGGRVVRWRHNLYETWHVDKIDLAILAELVLRGPQTEGELRTRVSRMEALDDLDALKAALKPLVERKLVVYLTPVDRRGAVVTHGFHNPQELERLRARAIAEPVPIETAAPTPAVDGAVTAIVVRLEEKVPALEAELAALKALVTELQAEVKSLKLSLGG